VFTEKVPEDGLTGLSDEDNLGFTYAVLDRYIREGICEDETVKAKIDRMHELNLHKLNLMPCYVLKTD
jgi:NAD+ synthase